MGSCSGTTGSKGTRGSTGPVVDRMESTGFELFRGTAVGAEGKSGVLDTGAEVWEAGAEEAEWLPSIS